MWGGHFQCIGSYLVTTRLESQLLKKRNNFHDIQGLVIATRSCILTVMWKIPKRGNHFDTKFGWIGYEIEYQTLLNKGNCEQAKVGKICRFKLHRYAQVPVKSRNIPSTWCKSVKTTTLHNFWIRFSLLFRFTVDYHHHSALTFNQAI